MSELDDDRLRGALSNLGDRAGRQIRPPGEAAAAAAGRRRRRRQVGIAGMGALALVLATGWVAWGAPPGREVAAPSCAPAEASAFLPINADDALRAHIGDVLQRSAEVESFRFASREEQWERFKVGFSDAPDLVASTRADDLAEAWKFTLRCASDFPAVRERLQGVPPVPGLDVYCTCDPSWHATPTPTGGASSTPPR
ncbi:hypothetical protein GCM10022255_041930 [Dactylosporangium darangshiense]|uniref:FtsX extracellular domain-containing protein n=1 Tax=Dactylosporangium darangshiense TaxID=579108 RepID=A0ABP8DA42_9ACTN